MQAIAGLAGNWFGKPVTLFAFFIGLSIVLRMATFGHPNIDGDETFYFLVGQAMHDGAVPYVDVWDRKPVGLFILYFLIAGFSRSVIAYQLAAALFAGSTAAVIALMAKRWAGWWGSALAGCAYLLLLPLFWGFGGQAPVFYNLFIAVAALLFVNAMPQLRDGMVPRQVYLATALCGIAITIKQTTVFESVYFGLTAAAALYRSSVPRGRLIGVVLALAALGAAPTLLVTAWYFSAGYWSEYWHAMVTSNLVKVRPDTVTVIARSLDLYFRLAPIGCAAVLGLVLRSRDGESRRFLVGWLLAALIGFLSVPNFYMHYALPLLVPLCVVGACFFARKDVGLVSFVVVAGLTFHWYHPFAFGYTRVARTAIDSMTRSVRQYDRGRGVFLFDGPPLLYAFANARFPSPLVLPSHFNYIIEKDVSHLNTHAELARVLANRPDVVVVPVKYRNPRNEDSWQQVLSYVHRNCRLVDEQNSYEFISRGMMAIYGDCNAGAPPQR